MQVNNIIKDHFLVPTSYTDHFILPYNIEISKYDLDTVDGNVEWDRTVHGTVRGVQFERRFATVLSRKIEELGLGDRVEIEHVNGNGERYFPVDIIFRDKSTGLKLYFECKSSLHENSGFFDLSKREFEQLFFNQNMIYVKGNFQKLPNGKVMLTQLMCRKFTNPLWIGSQGDIKWQKDMVKFMLLYIKKSKPDDRLDQL